MNPLHILVALLVVSALLLLVSSRRDNRRQLVAQRLASLTTTVPDNPEPSLQRIQRKGMLPQRFQSRFDAAFEATGNAIKVWHLPVTALIPALLVFAFFTQVLTIGLTPAALLATVAAVVAPILLLYMSQGWYQRQFLDVFPDALDLVARAVRAGLPVTEALLVAGREMADPVGHELRRAFEQVQIGVPLIEALQEVADRIRVPDFRFMVVALALQAKTGGSLAETLKNLSGVIRARKALRLKARSLSAEAKVSAIILAALPFVVGGAMYVMNRDLMRLLIIDPRGRFMVGVAFIDLLLGLTVMVVLVKKAVR